MNVEDFPLVIFRGQRLRVVPELKVIDYENRNAQCDMCVAQADAIGRGQCFALREKCPGKTCGYRSASPYKAPWPTAEGFIYLPEEKFEDYIVELVRRRVS